VEGLVLPFDPFWARSIYHLYVIRVRDRQQLREYLAAAGIGTGIHYPIPLHLQKAYSALDYREGDFPVTEKVSGQILSLPMYPELGRAEQKYVVEHVLAWLDLQRSVPSNYAREESAA
jgi:dTDP-4-amino-4,6-dideoxygalactose transaminase